MNSVSYGISVFKITTNVGWGPGATGVGVCLIHSVIVIWLTESVELEEGKREYGGETSRDSPPFLCIRHCG